LNVVFAGTPEFAATCLVALIESRHRVTGVLTGPDRPSGRGLSRTSSAVKQLADARGIEVCQPTNLNDELVAERLRRWLPDVVVVAAYGLILPKTVLDIPRFGAINVHASLLPRWRGAAPIQRALLAGDRATGISIMRMDAGLDTGPVLLQEATAISEGDTAGALRDRLAALGAKLVVQALDGLELGELEAMPQAAEGVTYATKIEKRETRIDWSEAADAICRRVRAFSPSPGASARVRDTELKIWGCSTGAGQGDPGSILAAGREGLLVACGGGAVLVTELQRAGGRRLGAAEFLRGFALLAGDHFQP
jgi:methionyl-tRNA formyltransferase